MHERNKFYIIGYALGVVIIVILITLWLIRGDTSNVVTYVTELKVVEQDGSTHETKTSSKDNCRYYFLNGEEVEKISSLPREVKVGIFELPTAGEEGYDIPSKEEPISELTWSSNLETSAKYLKYLELSGYTPIRSVYTPSYIELFLEKGAVVKRVLIFKESIMIGDLVQSYELPDVKTYFNN